MSLKDGFRVAGTTLGCALALLPFSTTAMPGPQDTWGDPEPVTVEGYADHVMEPALSCTGDMLLFNNRNAPEDQTDIHWAARVTDTRFQYRGKIAKANSDALDGVPAMDCQGNLYFVSTRSYFQTLSTIYRAQFKDGVAIGVEVVQGLAAPKVGLLNFDVDVSSDGNSMYFAEGTFDAFGGPWSADLVVAQRAGDRFFRNPHSKALLANVNTSEHEYAATLSHDGLELFFTRLSGWLFWPKLTIEYSSRKSQNDPWSASTTIKSISGFVEAPALAPGGKILYFHKKMEDGMHRLFLVRRP